MGSVKNKNGNTYVEVVVCIICALAIKMFGTTGDRVNTRICTGLTFELGRQCYVCGGGFKWTNSGGGVDECVNLLTHFVIVNFIGTICT